MKQHNDAVHQKIKDHVCNKCEAAFAYKLDLIIHQKGVHFGIKDHACVLCDAAFTRKGDLNHHVKSVHNKIKDKQCNLCDFIASTQKQVQWHIRISHLPQNKKFECNECHYSSYSKSYIDDHKKSVHTIAKELKCMYCNRPFALKKSLVNHFKGMHLKREKRVECNICEKKLYRNHELNRHIKLRHGLD